MLSEEGNDLSSIVGWTSIACWVVVYSPQIYENYYLKSGEGLSVLFVVVWLLGDLCNLVGAVWGGLLDTVIMLALYYSLCDIILLCQIYFYRWTKYDRPISTSIASSEEHGELAPLLNGSIRAPEKKEPVKKLLFQYTGALLFVVCTSVLAWWLCKTNEVSDTVPKKPIKEIRWQVQVIGWTSAILYLGARIPQIIKNFRTRCEGLSPALFFFAICGNTTYALSICAASLTAHSQREYLVRNASWLAGSSLTVFLDLIVLCQFFYYRSVDLARARDTD